MKPARRQFAIATNTPPYRVEVLGYVLGDYGARKERYNWEFTHLPTGVRLTGPWIETKGPAMVHLEKLALHGLDEFQQKIIDDAGGAWGLGLFGT